ncbi:RnfH family protein [Thermomonas paludicola]|uniref:RnfH family protein n=1 Tax=Thermomonas paludicola TaxID=2884874 RepID=UPI002114A4A7|nr:RnfH family protein [Thermomonas paludicola]
MRVQLLRAWPKRCESVEVELAQAACVGDALAAAGWRLEDGFVALAVFGSCVGIDAELHDGDRVELLRPLRMDPKQARRQRARRGSGR